VLAGCGSADAPEPGAGQELDQELDEELDDELGLAAGAEAQPDEPEPEPEPEPDEPEPEPAPGSGLVLGGGVGEIVIDQMVDGVMVERRALIVIPEGDVSGLSGGDQDDSAAALPVLVALHGNGGRPEGMLRDFRPLVDQGRFVALIPEGIERSWNLGREASTADDVAFIELLLDQLDGARTDTGNPDSGSGLDLDRVYAFGYSNGAGLVNQLVAHTDRFHAVAAAASGLTHDLLPTGPVAPVSFLSLHGTEDPVVPYDGGVGVAGHDFLPVEDSAALWADRFGCPAEPDATRTAGGNIRLEWAPCDDGHRVVHYGFEGADHGLPPDLEGGLLDLVIDFFETADRLAG